MISPELREYAEMPDRYAPVGAGSSVTRFDDGGSASSRVRTGRRSAHRTSRADEVAELLARHGRSIPPGQARHLVDRPVGAPGRHRRAAPRRRPRRSDRPATGASTRARPTEPPPTAGIEVQRIETYDDFVAAREVQWDAFETPRRASRSEQAPVPRTTSTSRMALGVPVGFLATLDGRPAATAMSIPSPRGVFLIAGSTAPGRAAAASTAPSCARAGTTPSRAARPRSSRRRTRTRRIRS